MGGRAPKGLLKGVGATLLAAYAATTVAHPHLPGIRVIQDLVPFIVPLVAGTVCLASVRRMAADARPTWILLGLGAIAWGLGDAGYSILELLGHDPGGALTFADVGYLALIPLWVAALVVHPSRSRRGVDRIGTSMDALAVVIAAAAITTAFVLIPELRGAQDRAGATVALAYPVADLALLAVFMATFARSAKRMRAGDVMIAFAILTFVVGDISYARLVLVGDYNVGHPIDLTWAAAFVCIMIGVSRGLGSRESAARPATRMPILTFCGMAGMIALIALAASHRTGQTVLLGGAVAAGLLVVIRLVLLASDRGRLVRSLDETIDELHEAEVARERFIATVSHDLRSPLTAIGGFASLLREPDILSDGKQVDELTHAIQRSTKRLTRLTDDLLLAGQFASGHPPALELERVDLRRAAETAAGDTGRADRVRISGRWAWALADPMRIQQILVNLLDNAFKHIDSTEEVGVRVRATDEGAVLEVSDTGTGIAPEHMATLFEAFVTDQSTRTSVGLGLYVVQNLVRAMDGRIAVTSEVDRGTTFKIILPTAPSVVSVVEPAAPAEVREVS